MTFGPSETERGREPFAATGRGGAGNMTRSPSRGRPAEERGETAAQHAYAEKQNTVSHGRGGVGNLRSPSRGPKDRAKAHEIEKHEREVQKAALAKEEGNPHATGRGGAGNVANRDHSQDRRGREAGGIGSGLRALSRSASRSRSREPRASTATGQDSHAPALPAVDEKSSGHGSDGETSGASSADQQSHSGGGGLLHKIAAHIPGHHSK